MAAPITVKILGPLVGCVIFAVGAAQVTNAIAQSDQSQPEKNASPIYGISIPAGYQDWRVISVSRLTGSKVKQARVQLGNDVAIDAYRTGKLPFPDGAIIAALHWTEVSSAENDKVLASGFPGALLQSFVPGAAVNVQFMVKDSKKYSATGGWGFADFTNGKPGNQALHETCFSCHQPARERDYVFTRHPPRP
jgi:hypothetical protein